MEKVARNELETDAETNSSDVVIEVERNIRSNFDNIDNSQGPIICSIDRSLLAANAAAYGAKVVIIGPLRKYKSVDEHLERQKRTFLDKFLNRPENKASLQDFCKWIKDKADKIRSCYEQTYCRNWDFSKHTVQQNQSFRDDISALFIEMIVVDACFIIELFLEDWEMEHGSEESNSKRAQNHSSRKKKRAQNQLVHSIRPDLFLAQNQLPFFILKKLYKLAFGGNPDFPSFLHLTCHFFSPYYNQNTSIEDILSPTGSHHPMYTHKLKGAKHFLDLLRTFQLPYSLLLQSSKTSEEREEAGKERGKEQGEYLYSAVLLREAGVKFIVSRSRCLLDIEFDEKTGELKIPRLSVDGTTESFFRNLMAWEQRYYPTETNYICDYIFLMVYLIKSTEDVDILVRKRIIINQLGSHNAVVTLLNNSCKNVIPKKNNHYSDIFQKLNEYHADPRHSWMAILKLKYFPTLWRGVATSAAILLLVLTLIQTICDVISLSL